MSVFVLKIKFENDIRRISLERTPNFEELLQVVKQLFSVSDPVIKYEDDEKDLVTVSSDMELKEAYSVATKTSNIIHLYVTAKNKTQPAPKAPEQQKQGLPNFFDPSVFGSFAQFLNPDSLQSFLQNVVSQGNVDEVTKMFQGLGLEGQKAQAQFLQFLQQFAGNAPWLQDLFKTCYQQGSCSSRAGNVPVNNNNSGPSANSNDPSVHEGVTCDGCQQTPILGTRFKCTACDNYDLCERCEAKGAAIHDPAHPMVKLSVPPKRPQFFGRGCPYKRWGPRYHPENTTVNNNNNNTNNNGGYRHRLLARFVQNVTIEDGTVVAPGAAFTKIWRVRNEGENSWPENTFIGFVGGDRLGTREIVPIPLPHALAPGQEVDVAVDMIAPKTPGRYISYWKLAGPQYSSRFGQRLWADINVDASPSPASEVPAPVPAPAPVLADISVAAPVASNTVAPMNVDVPAIPSPSPSRVDLTPTLTPVQQQPPQHVFGPVITPTIPIPTPAAVGTSTTAEEADALKTLVDMGFKGDLLALLRKNKGDIFATIRVLLAANN